MSKKGQPANPGLGFSSPGTRTGLRSQAMSPATGSPSLFGLISKVNQGILQQPPKSILKKTSKPANLVQVQPNVSHANTPKQKQEVFQDAKSKIEQIQKGLWKSNEQDSKASSTATTKEDAVFKVPMGVPSLKASNQLSKLRAAQKRAAEIVQSVAKASTSKADEDKTKEKEDDKDQPTVISLVEYDDDDDVSEADDRQGKKYTEDKALKELDMYTARKRMAGSDDTDRRSYRDHSKSDRDRYHSDSDDDDYYDSRSRDRRSKSRSRSRSYSPEPDRYKDSERYSRSGYRGSRSPSPEHSRDRSPLSPSSDRYSRYSIHHTSDKHTGGYYSGSSTYRGTSPPYQSGARASSPGYDARNYTSSFDARNYSKDARSIINKSRKYKDAREYVRSVYGSQPLDYEAERQVAAYYAEVQRYSEYAKAANVGYSTTSSDDRSRVYSGEHGRVYTSRGEDERYPDYKYAHRSNYDRSRALEDWKSRYPVSGRDSPDYRDRDKEGFRERDKDDYRERDKDDYRDRDKEDYRERDKDDYRDRDKDDYRDRDKDDYRERDEDDYRKRDKEKERERDKAYEEREGRDRDTSRQDERTNKSLQGKKSSKLGKKRGMISFAIKGKQAGGGQQLFDNPLYDVDDESSLESFDGENEEKEEKGDKSPDFVRWDDIEDDADNKSKSKTEDKKTEADKKADKKKSNKDELYEDYLFSDRYLKDDDEESIVGVKVAGKPGAKDATSSKSGAKSGAVPGVGYRCEDCDVTCTDKSVYEIHLLGAKHSLVQHQKAEEAKKSQNVRSIGRKSRFDSDVSGKPIVVGGIQPPGVANIVPVATQPSIPPLTGSRPGFAPPTVSVPGILRPDFSRPPPATLPRPDFTKPPPSLLGAAPRPVLPQPLITRPDFSKPPPTATVVPRPGLNVPAIPPTGFTQPPPATGQALQPPSLIQPTITAPRPGLQPAIVSQPSLPRPGLTVPQAAPQQIVIPRPVISQPTLQQVVPRPVIPQQVIPQQNVAPPPLMAQQITRPLIAQQAITQPVISQQNIIPPLIPQQTITQQMVSQQSIHQQTLPLNTGILPQPMATQMTACSMPIVPQQAILVPSNNLPSDMGRPRSRSPSFYGDDEEDEEERELEELDIDEFDDENFEVVDDLSDSYSTTNRQDDELRDEYSNRRTHAMNVPVPTPCGPLQAVEIKPSSVTLTWDFLSKDEEELIDKYVVEYRNARETHWVKVSDTSCHKYTVDGLQERTDYLFRVVAMNGPDKSDYLESILITTSKGVGSPSRRRSRDRDSRRSRQSDKSRSSRGHRSRSRSADRRRSRSRSRDRRRERRRDEERDRRDDKTRDSKRKTEIVDIKEETDKNVMEMKLKSYAIKEFSKSQLGSVMPSQDPGEKEKVECRFYTTFKKYNEEPWLGLDFVYETVSYNPLIAPFYKCKLCKQTGSGEIMVRHIIGLAHRMKCIKMHNPVMWESIRMLYSKKQRMTRALKEAKIIEDMEGRGSIKVMRMLNPEDYEGKVLFEKPVPVEAPATTRPKFNEEEEEAEPDPADSEFMKLYKAAVDANALPDKAIIGLKHIQEMLHPDGTELPMYKCNLCKCILRHGTILFHMIGKKHRTQYIKKNYPTLCDPIAKKFNRSLPQLAMEIEEKEGMGALQFARIRNDKLWLKNKDSGEDQPQNQGIKFGIKRLDELNKAVKSTNVLDEATKQTSKEILDWTTENEILQTKIQNQTIIKSTRQSRFLTVYRSSFSKMSVIGLQWVTEFQKPDPKAEPWYMCFMCQQKIEWKSIMDHVTSTAHRFNYLKTAHKDLSKSLFEHIGNSRLGMRQLVEEFSLKVVRFEGYPTQMEVMIELNINTEALKSVMKTKEGTKSSRGPTLVANNKTSAVDSQQQPGSRSSVGNSNQIPGDNTTSSYENVIAKQAEKVLTQQILTSGHFPGTSVQNQDMSGENYGESDNYYVNDRRKRSSSNNYQDSNKRFRTDTNQYSSDDRYGDDYNEGHDSYNDDFDRGQRSRNFDDDPDTYGDEYDRGQRSRSPSSRSNRSHEDRRDRDNDRSVRIRDRDDDRSVRSRERDGRRDRSSRDRERTSRERNPRDRERRGRYPDQQSLTLSPSSSDNRQERSSSRDRRDRDRRTRNSSRERVGRYGSDRMDENTSEDRTDFNDETGVSRSALNNESGGGTDRPKGRTRPSRFSDRDSGDKNVNQMTSDCGNDDFVDRDQDDYDNSTRNDNFEQELRDAEDIDRDIAYERRNNIENGPGFSRNQSNFRGNMGNSNTRGRGRGFRGQVGSFGNFFGGQNRGGNNSNVMNQGMMRGGQQGNVNMRGIGMRGRGGFGRGQIQGQGQMSNFGGMDSGQRDDDMADPTPEEISQLMQRAKSLMNVIEKMDNEDMPNRNMDGPSQYMMPMHMFNNLTGQMMPNMGFNRGNRGPGRGFRGQRGHRGGQMRGNF